MLFHGQTRRPDKRSRYTDQFILSWLFTPLNHRIATNNKYFQISYRMMHLERILPIQILRSQPTTENKNKRKESRLLRTRKKLTRDDPPKEIEPERSNKIIKGFCNGSFLREFLLDPFHQSIHHPFLNPSWTPNEFKSGAIHFLIHLGPFHTCPICRTDIGCPTSKYYKINQPLHAGRPMLSVGLTIIFIGRKFLQTSTSTRYRYRLSDRKINLVADFELASSHFYPILAIFRSFVKSKVSARL